MSNWAVRARERLVRHVEEGTTDRSAAPVVSLSSRPYVESTDLQLARVAPFLVCPSTALPVNHMVANTMPDGTPVLTIRRADGTIRAFVNRCRHRGALLLRPDAGVTQLKAAVLTCPYHSWSFDLDGKLKRVPGADGFPCLDKAEHTLKSLTCVEQLGAIWVGGDVARRKAVWQIDEVEAALDDANLGRLLEVLENLRESSQLVVITHQKRTMEIADVLYGVSMKQDGVTKVVSQKLEKHG